MTEIFVSPSFPNGLPKMRSEAEARGAYDHLGMSDDQASFENRARIKLQVAMETMQDAIAFINGGSAVVTVDKNAWDDFVHDELPTRKFWEEKVAAAR